MILALLTLFGCKTRKQINSTSTTAVSSTPTAAAAAATANNPLNTIKTAKLNSIRAKQTDFKTFAGKAAAKLSLDGDEHDVTMNIRIQKDQQIWVSITAILGIEVARAVITPDSIKVINRLQGNYLKKPFSYIYQYTSRQVNYKTIESILIGNAIPSLINDNVSFQSLNGTTVAIGTLQELAYQLTLNNDLKVTQTKMSSPSISQMVQVDNSGFIQATGRSIPSQININSAAKDKKIQVGLSYSKADFDQALDFPFSVPARYSVVN
jgi:hypothetical protein